MRGGFLRSDEMINVRMFFFLLCAGGVMRLIVRQVDGLKVEPCMLHAHCGNRGNEYKIFSFYVLLDRHVMLTIWIALWS